MKRSFSAENIVSIRSLNILLVILSLFCPRGAMSGSECESLALEIGGATDINDKGSHSESPVDPDDDVPLAEIKKRFAELEKVKQARSRKYLEDKLLGWNEKSESFMLEKMKSMLKVQLQ